jgi:hypothetical protein
MAQGLASVRPFLAGYELTMVRLTLLFTVTLVLLGCERKPEHYFVFCEGKDANGWNLIGTEYDGGYLIACTYQSPDRQQLYTARCRDTGCD